VSSFGGGQELMASEPDLPEKPKAEKVEKPLQDRRSKAIMRYKKLDEEVEKELINLKKEKDPAKSKIIKGRLEILVEQRDEAHSQLPEVKAQWRLRGQWDRDFDIQKANFDFEKIANAFEILIKVHSGEKVMEAIDDDVEFLLQRKDLPQQIRERYGEIQLDAIRMTVLGNQAKGLLMNKAKTEEEKKAVQQIFKSISDEHMRQLEKTVTHLRKTGWEIPEDLKKAAKGGGKEKKQE